MILFLSYLKSLESERLFGYHFGSSQKIGFGQILAEYLNFFIIRLKDYVRNEKSCCQITCEAFQLLDQKLVSVEL